VYHSLQVEKSMVEVAISLVVLCGESHDGSLLSYGFLLEGFTLFILVGCLLTVMVTIYGCIRCYGVVPYVSIHLLATVYLFTWLWSLFVLIGINTVGYWVVIMPRSMIRVVGSTWGFQFDRHCYVLVRLLRRA
jgi:hypothetical protein